MRLRGIVEKFRRELPLAQCHATLPLNRMDQWGADGPPASLRNSVRPESPPSPFRRYRASKCAPRSRPPNSSRDGCCFPNLRSGHPSCRPSFWRSPQGVMTIRLTRSSRCWATTFQGSSLRALGFNGPSVLQRVSRIAKFLAHVFNSKSRAAKPKGRRSKRALQLRELAATRMCSQFIERRVWVNDGFCRPFALVRHDSHPVEGPAL
jgi:hypothetical protein